MSLKYESDLGEVEGTKLKIYICSSLTQGLESMAINGISQKKVNTRQKNW